MTLLLLQVSLCLMVKVEPVAVMGIVVVNVPSLHVLHRGSPHDENPTGVSAVCLVCILVKWIDFPRPLEKVSPHSSHTLLFLSMVVVEFVSGG